MLRYVKWAMLTSLVFGSSCLECCIDPNQPGCPDFVPEGIFTPTFVLTFESLSTKTLPAAVDEDTDAKDVLVKDRVKFKPSSGQPVGLSKRLRMKSKVDGGAAALGSELQMTGDITAHVRIAVDSVDGLVDDQTLAFFERRPVAEAPPDRIEARWSTELDGFSVQALVDGVPLEMPGIHEVELIFLDFGDQIALQATGIEPQLPDGVPSGTLAFADQSGDDETATFAFGAEGLGPKGAIWFNQLKFKFAAGANPDLAETPITAYLALAWQALDDAEYWLAQQQDVNTANAVLADLNSAGSTVGNGGAWGLAMAANAGGTLLPTTDGDQLEATCKSATGLVIPASTKLFGILQGGGTSAASVKGHVKSAKKKVEIALALANGFKSKSHSKVDQAVEFSIE